jgi:predicted Zn-dependent protease with MMP-like domain
MICNIGLTSEFKDCFTETQQFRIYEGKQRSSIFGVSRFHTSEAWIFIDRIASYDKSYDYNIIEEITRTVVHELIHLCGVYDESAAHFGERLVK